MLLGQTLYAWACIRPGARDIEDVIRELKYDKKAHARWKTAAVLVIDEGHCLVVSEEEHGVHVPQAVSMVDGHLFDRICELAKRLRDDQDGRLQVRGVKRPR